MTDLFARFAQDRGGVIEPHFPVAGDVELAWDCANAVQELGGQGLNLDSFRSSFLCCVLVDRKVWEVALHQGVERLLSTVVAFLRVLE